MPFATAPASVQVDPPSGGDGARLSRPYSRGSPLCPDKTTRLHDRRTARRSPASRGDRPSDLRPSDFRPSDRTNPPAGVEGARMQGKERLSRPYGQKTADGLRHECPNHKPVPTLRSRISSLSRQDHTTARPQDCKTEPRIAGRQTLRPQTFRP
jgi:hypothetical protein